jgi:hypothetical protein
MLRLRDVTYSHWKAVEHARGRDSQTVIPFAA